ncbi:MAG: Transcriptional repressor, CopY family [Parcubacteria group bacterium GW2011_GWC2_45_7]|nr:MAG: Transcriptional repressor, CopY family [Parcubacteria group bacterium GW2011_GWC2_45_7]KKU73373.1 MAG: Transcriptional repressor, CopY family [Parcubacteria group bacterium GW2011_GWA2_47_26]
MALIRNTKKKGQLLGMLEKAILEALWQRRAGTVRDILQIVGRRRDLAYTTVMTVMTRMTEKGYLSREELPNGSFIYKPAYDRDAFYAKTSRVLFGEILRNFGSVAIAQFVDVLEEVDPRQLEELRQKLNRSASTADQNDSRPVAL